MTPEEVKKVRKTLGATARQLGQALGVDDKTVFAWESGEMFPTKQYVQKLRALEERGPSAFPKRPKGQVSGPERLSDPQLWSLLRKLVAHPALFDAANALARDYDDPIDV